MHELALLWCAAALGTLALTPLWPTLTRLLRPCVFRSLTGLPCPTCGATRAVLAVLRGDPGAALAVSPLATVAVVVFLAGGLAAPLWVWWGGPLPAPSTNAWRRVVFALLAATLINWVYLMVSP